VFATDDAALNAALIALEVFQQSPADFYPYSSKYDAVLRGTAKLSAAEARGLALFESPKKGNCAACHPTRPAEGGFPTFTDYGFVALGVPRNRALPGNADPAYFDLGLCGPLRTDLAGRGEYCGLFRTPSLRNVATRKHFFHNGAFTRLADAVRFYATRDATPARWYPHGALDDLPPQYRANVNREPPFGKEPALTEAEIADIVAFLGALTDGYGL
jgi:cytochrome c peroxidase